jgi:hypothetical protein
MLQNYSEIYWGGLKIRIEDRGEINRYKDSIIISTHRELWRGGPAELEAMMESHQLLKDAGIQVISSVLITSEKTVDNTSQVEVLDPREFLNGVTSLNEALKRAE